MATTNMSIRMDTELKKQAETMFADMGLNMTTAMNMFLRQVVRQGRIPFADGETLPEKYCDHSLTGEYAGYRECHILPDWLLIYRIEKDLLILGLTRTGTHSDLF